MIPDTWLTFAMTGVRVQFATSDDAIGLAALKMRWDLERGGSPDTTFIRRYADAWLAARTTRPAWIAKTADGNPVGYVLGAHVAKMPSLLQPGRGWLHLSAVYVDEGRRRQGVGKELLRAVENWATAHDLSRIQLNADDEARGLYLKVGFERPTERFMELRLGAEPQPDLRLF